MEDRRRSKRQRSWFVVRLESEVTGSWLAMSRNMSVTGALVATASRLEAGQPVSLTFAPAPGAEERTIEGRIVRMEPNAEDPDGLWPHRVAVEFSSEAPELEPLISEDSATWNAKYLLDLEGEEGSDE